MTRPSPPRWPLWLPKLTFVMIAAIAVLMALRSRSDTTLLLVASSVCMFVACWANATILLGRRAALCFVLIAVAIGWFAEQMGSSHGWFFGHYTYTEVLGWRIGDVPVIIPMMWFVLTYSAWVMVNLAVWRRPLVRAHSTAALLGVAFVVAAVVTAYDLGADPYMVYVLKAWIMDKKDGGWFGETLQGFVGWMLVACAIVAAFLAWHRSARPRAADHTALEYTPWDALLPLGIYGFSLLFQVINGHPVETRVIALFALGFPLLFAGIGLLRWRAQGVFGGVVPGTATQADPMPWQWLADAPADDTVARWLEPWTPATHAANIAALGRANALMTRWRSNADVAVPPAEPAPADPIAAAIQHYLHTQHALPEWADADKIARAERLFVELGPVSVCLLFCASLPQCYLVPDLSDVLHATGQLEQHTDYRVRATGAMVFAVLFPGGLTEAAGTGVAQTLKVRLIHAVVRNLILRRSPGQAVQGWLTGGRGADKLPPQPLGAGASMNEALLAHGWDIGEQALPCNQEELAYTLLTFHYVFLRGMRGLGLRLSLADEEAYLHTWNVVGHLLGIRRALMPHDMAAAERLFGEIQSRNRLHPGQADPRPALGRALMDAMAAAIPWRPLKPVPVLLTRYLCGRQASAALGLDARVGWLPRALFFTAMIGLRAIDALVGFFVPSFSFVRLATHLIGHELIEGLLLAQTRPLDLPDHLRDVARASQRGWANDAALPGWARWLQSRLTRHRAPPSA